MGDSEDLRIWHSSSHSYIRRQSGGVGDLFIDAYDSADIRIRNGNGATGVHDAVECYANNYVALNYQGQQKLRTAADGIDVYSGDGSTKGTVTADLDGNADTATTWATGISFDITGEVTGTAVSGIDGSNNINFVASIANNVIDEANLIVDVEKVIASILLVEDLRIQKD